MITRLSWIAALLVGCDGKAEEEVLEPVEPYACVHIADGELVDFAEVREEANTITVGREPWRVIIVQATVGYVAFETSGDTDLVLLLDYPGAVPAVWNGEERIALESGSPNPSCDEDLPEVLYFSVPGGSHALEIGPIYQAAVWLMLAEDV